MNSAVEKSQENFAIAPEMHTLADPKPSQTMTTTQVNPRIHQQALLLATQARLMDPNIIKFFWFPDEHEVRLIEVATDMQPSLNAEVQPFYVPASPPHDMPALSGVALIRDGEDGKLRLPKDWGTWDDAEPLKLGDNR